MGLTMSEKIKVVLKRRGMTMGELAENRADAAKPF